MTRAEFEVYIRLLAKIPINENKRLKKQCSKDNQKINVVLRMLKAKPVRVE